MTITHQLRYEAGTPTKYPIETIVDGYADCKGFSVLAASIMKAANIDVILLLYSNHVNVGVYLPYRPTGLRTGEVVWYEYEGKEYYVAEATGEGMDGGGTDSVESRRIQWRLQ